MPSSVSQLSLKRDVFITMTVCQYEVLVKLDVQPFGISYNDESDRIVVTCSTPLRQAVPFIPKSSRLLVYNAANGQLERVVPLDNSYEIPRHALAIGRNFVVCHGFLKYGKVTKLFV